MTVTAINARTGPLTANGVTPLPFTFSAIDASQIAVIRNGVQQTTGFTVALNGDGTGSITPTSSWGSDQVHILSNPNFGQPTNFTRYGGWFPDQLVPPLDTLAKQILWLRDRLALIGTTSVYPESTFGKPEAFGAVVNSEAAAATNTIAMQACLAAYPTMQLGPGKYYIDNRLLIMRNAQRIIGAGFTQTDQNENDAGYATEIISTSASATIIQIGSDSVSAPAGALKTEAVVLEGFTVNRSVNPFTHATTLQGSIGIALRWAVNCHFNRVFSLNSAIGFHFYGVVSNFIQYCSALRDMEGSNAANDTFVGFYFDHNAPAPYNGGNASNTLLYCRVFPLTEDYTPALTYSAGVRFDGGWVDTFIKGLEAGANIQYGIHGIGDGIASTTLRTGNLSITDCVLDPGTIAGIKLQDAGKKTAVIITNNYVSPSADAADGAIRLVNMAGSLTVANNQIITTTHSGVGLAAINVTGLRAHGNIYTNVRQPIYLEACPGFAIDDTVSNTTGTAGDFPAVQLTNCGVGTVTPIIRGGANAYLYGVMMWSTLNTKIEVNVTGINAGAIAGGAANKLVHNGTQITAVGTFGTNCLGSGIFA